MKIFVRILFFTYILVIFFLSVYPYPEKIIKTDLSDKIEHAVAFAVYVFLFYFSFVRVSKLFAFLTGLIFGILIEIAQIFSPNRDPSLLDIVADVVGLGIGLLGIVMINKINKGHKAP
ncbi:MAG: hypothetical protein GXO22_02130 [Aquificae bacterium]|nr:hypothetical protein [Aquificota bacterium]